VDKRCRDLSQCLMEYSTILEKIAMSKGRLLTSCMTDGWISSRQNKMTLLGFKNKGWLLAL
jgi:hypothetical protein